MTTSSKERAVRIGAILSGVFLVAAALLGHRVGLGSSSHLGVTRIYRAAALLALNTLVLLIGLQLASAVVLRIMEPPAEPAQQDQRTSPYYRTRDWAAGYWSEWDAMREKGTRYRPYVLSRWSSFDGQHIGIDEEGYRRTRGSVCEAAAYRMGNARIAARIEAEEGEFEPRLSDLPSQSSLYNPMRRIMRKPGPAPAEATRPRGPGKRP